MTRLELRIIDDVVRSRAVGESCSHSFLYYGFKLPGTILCVRKSDMEPTEHEENTRRKTIARESAQKLTVGTALLVLNSPTDVFATAPDQL